MSLRVFGRVQKSPTCIRRSIVIRKLFLITSCMLLLAPLLARAEIIELHSGKIIQGKIVSQVDDKIAVDTGVGVAVTYYREDIKQILNDDRTPFAWVNKPIEKKYLQLEADFKKNLEAEKEKERLEKLRQEQAANLPVTREEFIDQRVEEQVTRIEENIDQFNEKFPVKVDEFKTHISHNVAKKTDQAQRSMAAMGKLALQIFSNLLPNLLLFLYLTSWLVGCYPTMLLADRMKVKHSWLAFLPLVHILLLIRMARKQMFWFIHIFMPLLVVYVPFATPITKPEWWFFTGSFLFIANLFVVPIIMWCKVCVLLKKPAWLGTLMAIPGVNVYIIFYIARLFEEETEADFKRQILPHNHPPSNLN